MKELPPEVGRSSSFKQGPNSRGTNYCCWTDKPTVWGQLKVSTGRTQNNSMMMQAEGLSLFCTGKAELQGKVRGRMQKSESSEIEVLAEGRSLPSAIIMAMSIAGARTVESQTAVRSRMPRSESSETAAEAAVVTGVEEPKTNIRTIIRMQIKTAAETAVVTAVEEPKSSIITIIRMQMETAAKAAVVTGVEEPTTSIITIIRMQIKTAAEAAVITGVEELKSSIITIIRMQMETAAVAAVTIRMRIKIIVNNQTLQLQNTVRSRLKNSYRRENIMCSNQEPSGECRGRALYNMQ